MRWNGEVTQSMVKVGFGMVPWGNAKARISVDLLSFGEGMPCEVV